MHRDFNKPQDSTPNLKRPEVRRPGSHGESIPIAPIRAGQRQTQSSPWKLALISGFGIGVVFVGLEFTKPAPEKEIVITLPSAAKPQPEKATAPETPVEAPIEPPVVAEEKNTGPVIPPPIPEERPAPEITATQQAFDFAKEKELVLMGLDAGRDAAKQRDKELFTRAMDDGVWTDYRKFLARSVSACLGKLGSGQGTNRFDAVWKEPALYQAFLRWQVLGHFTDSEIKSTVTDSYSGSLLNWLCTSSAAMEEFLLTIKPEDDAGKVLAFLTEAWPDIEGKTEKYFPLALACAVVFDRDVRIPHPVGGASDTSASVDPKGRFKWFIEKNEKGQLAAPVHRSSARDLVWVVCAPVSTSELEWSLKKMNLSQKHWGNAYGMINYLMERAVNGLNPYKEYTFAEILKEGGICGDQSYFCANTARAQGIPAINFSGETDLGGHAWVGLKITSNEWTTGVGRIGGVSKGQTTDPQTGKQLTEQEVGLWSERSHRSPLTTLAVARHLWLGDFFKATDKTSDQVVAVRLANQIGSAFVETWSALFGILKAQTKLTGNPAKPENLDEWKAFAKSMRQEYKDNPRIAQLAAEAETEFIFPYGGANDAKTALLRERRRIERDSSEQKDLIAGSLKREADMILKRGEPTAKEDISRLYDSALRKYGGGITGFKMMSDDYFNFLKSDPTLARKAARDIELAFKRVVETGTKDFFRAETEASISKMICGYYRAIGDEDRATLLEKRYEILLKRAKRSAL